MEASELSPLNSQSIPPKSSSSLPMKSFFNSLYTTYEVPDEAQSHPQCCWSGDGSASIQPGQKTQRISLSPIQNHEPSPTPRSPVKKLKIHQKSTFLLIFIWCKRNDLTTTKLSIFLSVADFANPCQVCLFMASVNCLRVAIATKGSKPHRHSHQQLLPDASPGGAKGGVIPWILDCKYSSVEQKLLWTRKTNYSIQ